MRPLFLVVERDERAIDRIQQRLRVVRLEFETGATIEAGFHSSTVSSSPPVARTTGTVPYLTHKSGSDRMARIGLASEDVGACLHLVRKGIVIADLHGETAGVGVGEVAKEFLVIGLAGPQRDNRNLALCEPPRDLLQ